MLKRTQSSNAGDSESIDHDVQQVSSKGKAYESCDHENRQARPGTWTPGIQKYEVVVPARLSVPILRETFAVACRRIEITDFRPDVAITNVEASIVDASSFCRILHCTTCAGIVVHRFYTNQFLRSQLANLTAGDAWIKIRALRNAEFSNCYI